MINYKGYIISTDPISPTLYSVATEGRGGKIPNILSGRFTSVSWVKTLIDKYLADQEEKPRGKANPKE